MNFLLFIKHKLSFLWSFAEYLNGLLVSWLWGGKIQRQIEICCQKANCEEWIFRSIKESELPALNLFFSSQPDESYRYFKPHGFELNTLRRLSHNPAFRMLGAWSKEGELVGYFLIRFFANRHAFVGFIVGQEFQGRGLAQDMGRVALNICWNVGFRSFATVAAANERALKAYRRINDFAIRKELAGGYLYIEYIKDQVKPQ